MTIAEGATIPEGTLLRVTPEGQDEVAARDVLGGARVALFAVPGAYTSTCSNAHMPSFVRAKPEFDARGVPVWCLAVNDPFVLRAWGEATGAFEAGIGLLADPAGDYATALGTAFDHPPLGFHNRSRRFAALIEGGVVRAWREEPGPGQFGATSGEALLALL